jgi:hypothetical protein
VKALPDLSAAQDVPSWNQRAMQIIGCCGSRREDSLSPSRVLAVRFCLHPVSFGDIHMVLSAHLQPIVALIAGVLILIMPRLLNFIVAIYLILIGIIGLGIIK